MLNLDMQLIVNDALSDWHTQTNPLDTQSERKKTYFAFLWFVQMSAMSQ